MRPPLDQGTILITGASAGIGRALALEVAPRGKVLVLVARRKSQLDELARELRERHPRLTVHIEACDLADRGQTDAMLASVEKNVGPVDILINNAGLGDMGMFDMADWGKTEQMITLNVVALAYLTHRLVRPMVERGRGGVLNISSGFGLSVLPGFAAYVGTKHFVSGFTEALRLDLEGTGVVVTQSCPGPVATEFASKVGNFTGVDTPSFIEISAAQCARESLQAFDLGRARIIPGFVIWLALMIDALTPRFLSRFVLAPIARQLRDKQLAAAAEG